VNFSAASRFAPHPSSRDWVALLLGFVLFLASDPVRFGSCVGCAADFRFFVRFPVCGTGNWSVFPHLDCPVYFLSPVLFSFLPPDQFSLVNPRASVLSFPLTGQGVVLVSRSRASSMLLPREPKEHHLQLGFSLGHCFLHRFAAPVFCSYF
jgi:hypothetical protein